jgi:hypothetical protein
MSLYVTNVDVHAGGGYLIFSGDLGGVSNCGGPKNMLAFSNDADGKAFLSVALVALSTGKSVQVYSKGTCASYQLNVEEMSSILINK